MLIEYICWIAYYLIVVLDNDILSTVVVTDSTSTGTIVAIVIIVVVIILVVTLGVMASVYYMWWVVGYFRDTYLLTCIITRPDCKRHDCEINRCLGTTVNVFVYKFVVVLFAFRTLYVIIISLPWVIQSVHSRDCIQLYWTLPITRLEGLTHVGLRINLHKLLE